MPKVMKKEFPFEKGKKEAKELAKKSGKPMKKGK